MGQGGPVASAAAGREWIDRWFADEEAEDLADLVSFQIATSPRCCPSFLSCS